MKTETRGKGSQFYFGTEGVPIEGLQEEVLGRLFGVTPF